MPGHANFVGGPVAQIRKLSSSHSSSSSLRRKSHLGGPSRIFRPGRENVQFDFPWVPALPDPHAGSRVEEDEEMADEKPGEGSGGWVEERERKGERAGGGEQREAKRKNVVLELLDNNPALGGFEAGKQALLDLDDWAGLDDSHISASDFPPPSPPPSRHHHQASSPPKRGTHRSRSRKQKKVVSDGEEEWEDGRELRRSDPYMQEEDDDHSSLDRSVYEDPQASPSHEAQHDTEHQLVDNDPHQPSPSPPRHQPEQQHQPQPQLQHQNRNQHQPNTRSSIATLPLTFSTNSQGVARPHPNRNYIVPSSNSSDGDANTNARPIGVNQFEGDYIVEAENEDLQNFGEVANDRDEQGMGVETSNSIRPNDASSTKTMKKSKRSSLDSGRITLGSSSIFLKHTSDRRLASPPYVSPSPPDPPAGRPPRTVASQQLQKDEQRWRASQSQNQRPLTSSSSKKDPDLPNPMAYLASRLELPDISGPASPFPHSPRPPSRSSNLVSETEMKEEAPRGVRGDVSGGGEVQQIEEEYGYQLNFDSRRWETHGGEEDEAWNDKTLGRRDDEEEIDVHARQHQ